MTMLFSMLGHGFQSAGKAEQAAADKPAPEEGSNPVQVQAPQQMQVQPTRQQNLSDAVKNLNVANQLAQQQQNASIEAKLNQQPVTSIPGAGQDAQLGNASAMAARAAHTAGQFAGPGNAAQAGTAAGQSAYAAGQSGPGVPTAQLAGLNAQVQQDTRDEQARQLAAAGSPLQSTTNMSSQAQQTMGDTMNYVNANNGVPGSLLNQQNMSQQQAQPNTSGYQNDLYQSAQAFR